jgi:hypothetical protein
MTKKSIIYTETGSGYRYANYATIDDVQFPQVRQNNSIENVYFFLNNRVQEKVKKKQK